MSLSGSAELSTLVKHIKHVKHTCVNTEPIFGLLGEAVFPEGVLSGKTKRALPDLFPLETEPGSDHRVWCQVAVEWQTGKAGHSERDTPDAPSKVKKARERSLGVHGAHLFNLLPKRLRNEDSGDFELFKNHLDIFLAMVPDQPTTTGMARAALSNSLLDQVPLVQNLDLD